MKSFVTVFLGTIIGFQTTAFAPASHPCIMAPQLPDPIASMSTQVQKEFACIAYAESRNKLVDTNVSSGAQGKFQILPYLWQFARASISGLPSTPNEASSVQQDTVALWFYERNNGFLPEWASDSQCFR